MLRTRYTELLGIEHPVASAGMGGGATSGELVAFLRTIVRNRAIDALKHHSRWIPTASPGEGAAPELDLPRKAAWDACKEAEYRTWNETMFVPAQQRFDERPVE